jgi:hypothetical protein
MAITRTAFASFIRPDLFAVYLEVGKRRRPEYSRVFNVIDMPWNPITNQQVSGLGPLQPMPEGTTFPADNPILGGQKSFEAVPYGLKVEITFPMWQDDLYTVMRAIMAELATSSFNKIEVDAFSVLNGAFDTTQTGFTPNESLCSTSHVGLDGVIRSNRPNPDTGLSVLAIQGAIVRFENMTNERGIPQAMAPSLVLVAPENRFVAREILGSAGAPYTANNEQNSLIQDDLRWMVCHYFTNPRQWFAIAEKGSHDLHFMFRTRPIFDVFDDPNSKNAIATVYQRHTKGFGSWRGVDGSTGG